MLKLTIEKLVQQNLKITKKLDIIFISISDIDNKLKNFINETNKSMDLNNNSLKVMFISSFIYLLIN